MNPSAFPPPNPNEIAQPAGEGRIARGFRLARQSWDVLASDRRLLALPLLAVLCALLAMSAMVALAWPLRGGPTSIEVLAPVWAVVYVISFATIFFNAALIHVVAARWRGEPAGLSDGLAAARGRVAAIACWAVLTTTVGLVLQLIHRLTMGVSEIVLSAFADVAWSVASFFVVPVLVIERRGPARSLRRSVQIVRSHWVEGLAGGTPIALATLIVMLPIGTLMFIGFILYVIGFTVPGLVALVGGTVAAITVWVVSAALGEIFTLAVFQHATSGPAAAGFPLVDLERPRVGTPSGLLRRLRARRS